MPVFGSSRPSIKVKAMLRWPARFLAGVGIAITRANGNITIGLDYDNLDDVTVETPADYVIPLLETTTGLYKRVSVDQLVAAGPQGDQGPQGEQGPQGDPGSVNPQGLFTEGHVAVFGNDAGTLIEDGGTIRDRLTSNRNYYVRTDGDNENDGLLSTAERSWETLQYAYDWVCDNLDLNGFSVTIFGPEGAGTVFTAGLLTSKSAVGAYGTGSIIIDLGGATVRPTGAACFSVGDGFGWGGFPCLTLQNMRLETTTAGDCLRNRGGIIKVGDGVVFGTCAGNHMFLGHMGQILCEDYTISGSAGGGSGYHIYAYSAAQITLEGATVTISTPVTFNSFITLTGSAKGFCAGASFVNPSNVTGAKFQLDGSGTTFSGDGTLTFLPGSTAGTIANGATYDGFEGTSSTRRSFAAGITATGARSYIAGNSEIYALFLAYNATRRAADQCFSLGATDSATPDLVLANILGQSVVTAKNSRVVQFGGYGAGTLSTDASGNISASSDETLKYDVQPFTRGLPDLRNIGGADTYGWRHERDGDGIAPPRPDARYAGFIAQKVQRGIPEAVGVGPDGKLTLQDRPLIGALVNAVLELEDRLEALESR